jgi:hypothetical protein
MLTAMDSASKRHTTTCVVAIITVQAFISIFSWLQCNSLVWIASVHFLLTIRQHKPLFSSSNSGTSACWCEFLVTWEQQIKIPCRTCRQARVWNTAGWGVGTQADAYRKPYWTHEPNSTPSVNMPANADINNRSSMTRGAWNHNSNEGTGGDKECWTTPE